MKSSKSRNLPAVKSSGDRHHKNIIQLIWGVALILMGIGVVFRVSVVIERIGASGDLASGLYFLRFCFYLIATILIGGGIKKISGYRSSGTTKNQHVKND